jgi:hypothetical protein
MPPLKLNTRYDPADIAHATDDAAVRIERAEQRGARRPGVVGVEPMMRNIAAADPISRLMINLPINGKASMFVRKTVTSILRSDPTGELVWSRASAGGARRTICSMGSDTGILPFTESARLADWFPRSSKNSGSNIC